MIKIIKKIYAQTIWLGSLLGVFGLAFLLIFLSNDNENYRTIGVYVFMCGILVLIISIIMALILNIYFIAENDNKL